MTVKHLLIEPAPQTILFPSCHMLMFCLAFVMHAFMLLLGRHTRASEEVRADSGCLTAETRLWELNKKLYYLSHNRTAIYFIHDTTSTWCQTFGQR